MRRLPAEYLLLTSLVASLAFWGFIICFGAPIFSGDQTVARIQVAVLLSLAAISLWQLWRRRLAGVVLCAVFYGAQLVSVTLRSGRYIGFNSLPTIYYRIYGEAKAPINLNLVSLVLFIFSVLLWVVYRRTIVDDRELPPNTSLERTRGG
jgi:glucan phosphoethanolaminetransferase (alkaline phosphatase superfamily)